MIRTQFQPYITVWDNGRIDVDLNDIEVDSLDDDGRYVDAPTDEHGYSRTASILDRVLYGDEKPSTVSKAKALRNLADYLEKQNAS